jgi:hypothetical protein
LLKIFEEVLDGAGGTFDRLASAIVKQISLALRANAEKNMIFPTLTTAMSFLAVGKNKEWISILLSRGIIAHVLSALRTLDGFPTPTIPEVALRQRPQIASLDPRVISTKTGFEILINYITAAPGYLWVAEAIEGGLLNYLISSAAQGRHHDMHLKLILGKILPLSLTSHAVITQMKKALPSVQKVSGSRRFMESPLFPVWEDLVALVTTRVVVLDSWEAAGAPSSIACDNMLASCNFFETNFRSDQIYYTVRYDPAEKQIQALCRLSKRQLLFERLSNR